jgi:hypothetical protein
MTRKEPRTTAEYVYTVLLRAEPEGSYTVTCPALPGLVTFGEIPRGSPPHGRGSH